MRKNPGVALAVLVLGSAVAAPIKAQSPVGPQLHSPFYNDAGTTGSTADFFQTLVQQTDAQAGGTGIASGTPLALDFSHPGPPDCLPGHGAGPNCLLEALNVATPEPGTMVLIASGLAGAGGGGGGGGGAPAAPSRRPDGHRARPPSLGGGRFVLEAGRRSAGGYPRRGAPSIET